MNGLSIATVLLLKVRSHNKYKYNRPISKCFGCNALYRIKHYFLHCHKTSLRCIANDYLNFVVLANNISMKLAIKLVQLILWLVFVENGARLLAVSL